MQTPSSWKTAAAACLSFNIKPTHLYFNLCIPECWHARLALEPPANSYFYTFLLKKHDSPPTMNYDAFPGEWMENSAMC